MKDHGITWTGKIVNWKDISGKDVVDDYQVYFNYKHPYVNTPSSTLGWGPLCHTDSVWRWLKNYPDPICSWGYSGKGTYQLAIAMLGWSLTSFLDVTDPSSYWNVAEKETHPLRKLILDHHVAFADEVLAALPNNWTMTSGEIMQWLNQRINNERREVSADGHGQVPAQG